MLTQMLALLIPIVAIISVFTFISVAAWAAARTKEREAFYRSELYRKLADSTGTQVQAVLASLREEERNVERKSREKELNLERKSREGMRLGGLVVSLVGVGLIAMIASVGPKEAAWTVGLIPLAVGVALLVYVYVLAPPLPAADAARWRTAEDCEDRLTGKD